MAVVPERAAGHLRRTADVRFLEPPTDLPPITEIAAELDQARPGRRTAGPGSRLAW